MGRIRTTMIKRTAENFLLKHPDKFQPDFDNNKKVLTSVAEIHSKKLRNFIAGYITHLIKKKQ